MAPAGVEILVGVVGDPDFGPVVACAAAGHSTHATALKAAVGRLERRLAPLGLRLRSIRARGYLLEVHDDDFGDLDAAVL